MPAKEQISQLIHHFLCVAENYGPIGFVEIDQRNQCFLLTIMQNIQVTLIDTLNRHLILVDFNEMRVFLKLMREP